VREMPQSRHWPCDWRLRLWSMMWWKLSWCPGRWNKHRLSRGWHHVTRYRLYSSQGRSSRDCPTYRANTTGGLSIDHGDFMEILIAYRMERAAAGSSRWERASEREQPGKALAFPGCSTDRYSIGLLSRLSSSGLPTINGKALAPRCYGGAGSTPAPEGDPRRETRMILKISSAVSR
jgi:hypothetical protein